jgi:uncharacterized hydrophobic protein (TIGR00271 family)
MTPEQLTAVTKEVFYDGSEWVPFLWRFSVLIVLSTLIATLGLVEDSVAVIIGAMLVAPLMTPILTVAAALALSDIRHLARGIGVLLYGIVLAVGVAWIVTRTLLRDLTVASDLPGEVLARTNPSLLDLGVAIAAGLAGGYVLTHPRAVSSAAGVAIAVALVPPLATVGISIAVSVADDARGAALLFATNLVAIVLAALAVMTASGFRPEDPTRRSSRAGLVVTGLLLVAVAVPLTLHTTDAIVDRAFGETVSAQVAVWDPNASIVAMTADVAIDGTGTVDLEVATTSPQPAAAWRLAEALAAASGREVEITVQVDVEELSAATSG